MAVRLRTLSHVAIRRKRDEVTVHWKVCIRDAVSRASTRYVSTRDGELTSPHIASPTRAPEGGSPAMKLVVFGLTMSSSWGNGHATLWRGLCRSLVRRGHEVVFFERDVPYYAAHRDLIALDGVQ